MDEIKAKQDAGDHSMDKYASRRREMVLTESELKAAEEFLDGIRPPSDWGRNPAAAGADGWKGKRLQFWANKALKSEYW